MNENKATGAAKVVLGKFESAAGEALGDPEMEARGGLRQAGGYAQEAAGTVEDVLEGVADRAKAAAATLSDAYDRVSDTARGIGRRVEDRPYMSVGVGVAVGLLVGLIMASRGPKVIYVKPRD
ncbi:MAG: hypothetical protein M3T55_07445 [Pseudomonadota bacterium]|nr:hypothetical protein [Pseudomonadota bacterium]